MLFNHLANTLFFLWFWSKIKKVILSHLCADITGHDWIICQRGQCKTHVWWVYWCVFRSLAYLQHTQLYKWELHLSSCFRWMNRWLLSCINISGNIVYPIMQCSSECLFVRCQRTCWIRRVPLESIRFMTFMSITTCRCVFVCVCVCVCDANIF